MTARNSGKGAFFAGYYNSFDIASYSLFPESGVLEQTPVSVQCPYQYNYRSIIQQKHQLIYISDAPLTPTVYVQGILANVNSLSMSTTPLLYNFGSGE